MDGASGDMAAARSHALAAPLAEEIEISGN
jgi:hypothetical protein